MEWYYILLICIGAVVFLLFALALAVYFVPFRARYDKNPLLKYFTAEDFSLSATPVSVWKNQIHGYIYRDERVADGQKLVVFCHGMGAGHAAYMTEIAYFCSQGCTVLALDSKGCGLSLGKSMRGMYEGVRTAVAAIDYAQFCGGLGGYKLFLVGHSWGGYSALCAAAERKVDGVVAMSAPVTPVKTLYSATCGILSKPIAALLCPFWAVIEFFNFGFNGNANAARRAQKCGAPVLLIHGGQDATVSLNTSAYAAANGENITKYLAAGKRHNPYNTVAAEDLLAELSSKLATARKMSEEEKKFFKDFDFVAATQEDGEVMNAILSFISGIS